MLRNLALMGSLMILTVILVIGCNGGGNAVSSGEWQGLPPVYLTGKILDQNGQPAAGAAVSLWQEGRVVASGTTGSDGTFQVAAQVGNYIAKTKYGTPELEWPVSLQTGRENSLNITIGPNSFPRKVSGKITTQSSSVNGNIIARINDRKTLAVTGLSNILVQASLQGSTAVIYEDTTDNNGNYDFTLNPGTYSLVVSGTTVETTQKTITVAGVDLTENIEVKSLSEVSGSTSGSGTSGGTTKVTLTGIVQLNSNDEPLANITVAAYIDTNLKASTITTPEGKFIMENLEPAMYYIYVGGGSSAYTPATYVVQILSDGTVSPTDPILKISTKIITTADVVHPLATGTIIDSFTKTPLQYVKASLKGFGDDLTDINGNFSFVNLVPGNYELTLAKGGWTTLTVNFTITAVGSATTMTPSSLNYALNETQETNLGALGGRFVNETTGIGVNGLIVRVYKLFKSTKTIQVMKAGQLTDKDVTYWELENSSPQPVVSTRTGVDLSSFGVASGTFRLEYIYPTSDTTAYVVYLGTGNSTITTSAFNDPADQGNPLQVWWVENTVNANRSITWWGVQVTANTTTYLTNYNLPNY